MSHIVSSKHIITDISCLKRAIKNHFPQLVWMEGQRTFAWYGEWMNDYDAADAAYKLGIDPKDYGKCDHAIRMPGVEYEIGIMKRADGKGWSPVWDFFADGKKLSKVIGQNAEKLMAAYHEECARAYAEEHGLELETETDDNDEVVFVMKG